MKAHVPAVFGVGRLVRPLNRFVRWRTVTIMAVALWSTTAPLPAQPNLTLEEALDATNLVWTSGWRPWRAQANVTQDGVDAAECGPLRSGIVAEVASLETSVQGPGTLSFWWKAAATNEYLSGPDFSYAFCVDGAVQVRVSEESFHGVWQHFVVPISTAPGQLTKLKWLFSTLGGCTDPAEGTAWLDNVSFTPAEPGLALSRLGQTNLTLILTAPVDGRFEVQQSTDLLQWQPVPGLDPVQLQNGQATTELPTPESPRCFYRLLWAK